MPTVTESRQEKADIESLMYTPEIGELCRKGKTVFYCYINGQKVERYTRFEMAEAIYRAGGTFCCGAR